MNIIYIKASVFASLIELFALNLHFVASVIFRLVRLRCSPFAEKVLSGFFCEERISTQNRSAVFLL